MCVCVCVCVFVCKCVCPHFCVQFNRSKIEKARYAWILYGWYSNNWWRETANVNCSEDELVTILERALVVQQYPTTNTTTTTDAAAAAAIGGDVSEHIHSLSCTFSMLVERKV